jgi:hypothetical protein
LFDRRRRLLDWFLKFVAIFAGVDVESIVSMMDCCRSSARSMYTSLTFGASRKTSPSSEEAHNDEGWDLQLLVTGVGVKALFGYSKHKQDNVLSRQRLVDGKLQ